MEIYFTQKAQRSYRKFPVEIKKKVDKQLRLLQQDLKHPLLNVKKMSGYDIYEARVDWHYRMVFVLDVPHQKISVITIGQHDEGLGKK